MSSPRLPITAALVPLLSLSIASPAHADDAVVTELERLADVTSDGGSTITAAEVDAFVASVPATLSGDEAVLGLVVASRLRREVTIDDAAYSALKTALRHRVEGLGVSLLQAPGVTFQRATSAEALGVTFDAAGVAFVQVDLVYTWDGWTTTRAATLDADGDTWRATLAGAPASGRLQYAVHVFGPDGGDYWLNYGVENGVGGGNQALDYSLDLAATVGEPVTTSAPVLAKLVRMFTHPASPGGYAVVSAELDALVEDVTWEGGPAIQDDDVLDPAIQMIEQLVADGVDFQVDHELMIGFLDRQRLRFGTLPGIDFVRDSDGRLEVVVWAHPGLAELYWSTDGWNLPHSQVCAPSDDGATCDLGYVPSGALIAYTLRLTDAQGRDTWHHVDRGLDRPSNFFHRVP
jgi:hypothetical protein